MVKERKDESKDDKKPKKKKVDGREQMKPKKA